MLHTSWLSDATHLLITYYEQFLIEQLEASTIIYKWKTNLANTVPDYYIITLFILLVSANALSRFWNLEETQMESNRLPEAAYLVSSGWTSDVGNP